MTGLARARVVGALALTAVLASVPARAQVPLTGNDLAAVQQWMVGLEEYLMIREQAAGTVPLPRTSPDLPQVLEARTALASAIRDRRAGAKIGDLFTFEVRRTFRKLIARSIIAHEVVMSDLLAAVRRQIGPGSFRLTVNQPFPRQLAAVPSCVLDLLPPLPWELDFRIADHDLVLIDLGSGLVIDILSDALPRLVTGGWRRAVSHSSAIR
jgi:hypothetical protein